MGLNLTKEVIFLFLHGCNVFLVNISTYIFIILKGLPEEEYRQSPNEAETILPTSFVRLKPLEAVALSYVAGYIVKIKTKLTNCVACKYNILKRPNENDDNFNCLIKYREYGGKNLVRLKYCNIEFIENLIASYNITKYILSNTPRRKRLLKYILTTVKANVQFNFIDCEHSQTLKDDILQGFLKLIVFNYFNGVNNVIMGKDERERPTNESVLWKQAKEIYTKRRRYNK